MAPIKFEDHIKEKLEQRRLPPSINAWETLQNKLEAKQASKSNKTFWWLGIAASFIGILIVASVFFNKKNDNTIEQNVVDIEEVQEPKAMDRTIIQNKVEEEITTEKSKVVKEALKTKKSSAENPSKLKTLIQQKQKELVKGDNKDALAQFETASPNDLIENNIKAETQLSYENLKIQEVVAQVLALKKANNTVSEAEINKLLDQAQRDIVLHNLYNDSTKKVDANALLQDVEADLEQSFRDRAFKAIKSGYNYVKTTVAERNN